MLRDNYIQAKVPANGIRDVDQGRAFAVKESGSPHDLRNGKIAQPTSLVSLRPHKTNDSTVVRDRERSRQSASCARLHRVRRRPPDRYARQRDVERASAFAIALRPD